MNLTNPSTLGLIALISMIAGVISAIFTPISTIAALRSRNPSATTPPTKSKPQRVRRPIMHFIRFLTWLLALPVVTYFTLLFWYDPLFPGSRYILAIPMGILDLAILFLFIPLAISDLIRGEPVREDDPN